MSHSETEITEEVKPVVDIATLKLNRALAAFEWLPLERWIPNQLFNFMHYPGGQMCKICDAIITVTDQEDHVAKHIEQEKERRKEVKEAEGVTPRERRSLDTDGVLEYLSTREKGETVAAISFAMARNVNDVYKEIKVLISEGKVEIIGEHKIPGKRGRAAKIYGKKEVQ